MRMLCTTTIRTARGSSFLIMVDPRGVEPLTVLCHRTVLPIYYGPLADLDILTYFFFGLTREHFTACDLKLLPLHNPSTFRHTQGMTICRNKSKNNASNSGFTIVELVVVMLVFAVLVGVGLSAIPSYLTRRRDNQRKADLHLMKFSFEDYMNDKNCYPPVNQVQSCESTVLAPYMRKVPCDPRTNQAYTYILSADCRSYQIYTNLENTNDADVTALGCQTGCGPGNAYNYGVVGGNAVFDR